MGVGLTAVADFLQHTTVTRIGFPLALGGLAYWRSCHPENCHHDGMRRSARLTQESRQLYRPRSFG